MKVKGCLLDMIEFNLIPPTKTIKFISNVIKSSIGYDTQNVIKVRSDKAVYKVTCDKGNVRVDLSKRYFRGSVEQQIAYDSGVNVPKIYCLKYNPKIKISEWIDGELVLNLSGVDDNELFSKYAILVAKLNSIKHENLFLTNGDLNLGNLIWTPSREIYMIDLEKLKFVDDITESIVKLLLKRIRNRSRIDIFLEEYSKYKNIDSIISKCNQMNWIWRKK